MFYKKYLRKYYKVARIVFPEELGLDRARPLGSLVQLL
jgi:hypothetical protein